MGYYSYVEIVFVVNNPSPLVSIFSESWVVNEVTIFKTKTVAVVHVGHTRKYEKTDSNTTF